jgi:5-methyltetrahydropteroyltriglutamate--homocysteine methyltransferase
VGRSDGKILTTHVGALPPPASVFGQSDPGEAALADAVAEVIRLQRDCGIDLVNEGEVTKGGNWVTYVNGRFGGFEPTDPGLSAHMLTQSEDWIEFADFYDRAMARGILFEETGAAPDQRRHMDWVCTAPITYNGEGALQREITLLKDALGDTPVEDAFLTSTAPASIEVGRRNDFYKSEEEFVFAIAEALSVEYEAIAAVGLNVQVDDAWTAALWDRIGVKMGLKAYHRYCMIRVEALNHALRNIPESQIRYHLCWGSWHGPHAHDIELKDIISVMLAVNAGTYLFEAANVRHEHEYGVWNDVRLPDGKRLAPGVVTHSTPLVEHPDLVAMRIRRFVDIVGPERVIASTDCGLGLRCHPQIAWAKLKSLSEGARRASAVLQPA